MYGLGNSKMDLPNRDKQQTIVVKKTALQQNDNKMTVPTSFLKDNKDLATDSNRVLGAKRSLSDYPLNHHLQQPPPNNAANGPLVYVRRKSEAELGKSTACENPNINAYCTHSGPLCCDVEVAHTKPCTKEPKVSCFPAFTPFPVASSMNSSGKPSLPISLGNSAMRLAPAESNYVTASSSPTIGLKNVHWEERYHQLQMFLRKLNLSDQEEYIQMLRSLSSVELSRHAVELEKRSIHLSLEEAKELQRVAVLNVLGKPVKNIKASAVHGEYSDKAKTSS